MAIAEGILTGAIYDGLKFGGKLLLGPYFGTFQKAQKMAQKQLKKEFSEGELLAIFTTFNNMEWKLSFGKEAREEVNRNLIKGVEAINGRVFVDELVSELHENHKQYDIELVKKIVGRFVEIVSEELRTNHEIHNYLQSIDLERLKEKIDWGFEAILDGQKRLKQKLDGIATRMGELKHYEDGIPQSENLNLKTQFDEGKEHLKNHKYDRAIKAFRAALVLQHLKPSEAIALLTYIGIAQYQQGKWDQAIGNWKEALETAEKAGDEEGQTAALGNLGLVYLDKGEWDMAIAFHERTLRIDEKIGDEHSKALTLNNLGLVYQYKGEWDKAIEYYNKSLNIEEKVGDEYGMVRTLTNLGVVYQDKGQLDEACELFNKSLKLQEKMGVEYAPAHISYCLGYHYSSKGTRDKAIEFYNKALKGFEKIGDERAMAFVYRSLGSLHLLKGKWDEASEFFEKSLKLDEKIGNEHGIASAKADIGILYKAQGKKDEARKLLEESLRTLERIGDRPIAKVVREHLENL